MLLLLYAAFTANFGVVVVVADGVIAAYVAVVVGVAVVGAYWSISQKC